MGSTSFTPLSCGGLCEAVIMTPIHFPLKARERRAAIRPTRVKTESKTSLPPSVLCLRVGADGQVGATALRLGSKLDKLG